MPWLSGYRWLSPRCAAEEEVVVLLDAETPADATGSLLPAVTEQRLTTQLGHDRTSPGTNRQCCTHKPSTCR